MNEEMSAIILKTTRKDQLVARVPERHERPRTLVDRQRLDGALDEVARVPHVDLSFAHLGESRRDDTVHGSHPLDARSLDTRVRVGDRDGR